MKYCSIFSVTSKSAITPSFIGRIATMLPGVRPSISLALLPTASTLWVTLLMATIEGSETTMPRPRANTSVFAVPRSIAKSLENRQNIERRFIETDLRTSPDRSSLLRKFLNCGCDRVVDLLPRAAPKQHIAKGTLNEVIGKNNVEKPQ